VPRAPIRVMVVDDHPDVRRVLRGVLETAGGIEVCGEAGSVAESSLVINRTEPDIAIIDLGLPDGNGVSVARELRARWPAAQVVILTSADEEEAERATVAAGAATYLLKQVRGAAIVETVRSLADDRGAVGPAVAPA